MTTALSPIYTISRAKCVCCKMCSYIMIKVCKMCHQIRERRGKRAVISKRYLPRKEDPRRTERRDES